LAILTWPPVSALITCEKSGSLADEHQNLLRIFAQDSGQILRPEIPTREVFLPHPHFEMLRRDVGGLGGAREGAGQTTSIFALSEVRNSATSCTSLRPAFVRVRFVIWPVLVGLAVPQKIEAHIPAPPGCQ
jgi:hypothetical protein